MKGCETPDNLMILCPNHHKEFDYGDVKIIKHTKDYIEFSMNEEFYNVDLSIKKDIRR
jgi:predicted restriction endonuclease